MIADLLDTGAAPALERLVQFTAARHQLITDNIANLSTPYYRPRDLDPEHFQGALRDAIDRRRRQPNPTRGPLPLRDTSEVHFRSDGLDMRPRPLNRNVLFHDRNNRDLERLMQDLAENTLAHNAAIDLLKSQFEGLKTAIRERI